MGNVKNRKVSAGPKIIQLSNWSSLSKYLSLSGHFSLDHISVVGDLIFCSLVTKYLPGSLMSSLLSAVSEFLCASVCFTPPQLEERVTRRNERKLITLRMLTPDQGGRFIGDFWFPSLYSQMNHRNSAGCSRPGSFRCSGEDDVTHWWWESWDVALSHYVTLYQSYRRDSDLTQGATCDYQDHHHDQGIRETESWWRLLVITNESVAILSSKTLIQAEGRK